MPLDTYEKICSEGDWYVWRAKIMGVFYEISQNNERIRDVISNLSRRDGDPSLLNEGKLMEKLKRGVFFQALNSNFGKRSDTRFIPCIPSGCLMQRNIL